MKTKLPAARSPNRCQHNSVRIPSERAPLMTCTRRSPQTMQMSASCLFGANTWQTNAEKDGGRGSVHSVGPWLRCPRVLGELFMKVLTEEGQVQQGAFLRGATTAGSQVGLGLSCGLWILMMDQWSRYANLQCSVSPVSAEKSGCVRICNLCCSSTPCTLAPSLPLLFLPLRVSSSVSLPHTLSFVISFSYVSPSVCLFLNCSRPLRPPTPHSHLVHLCPSPSAHS